MFRCHFYTYHSPYFYHLPIVFTSEALPVEACMDHDRAEGEGVAPQEYTAIKIELLGSEWTSAMQKTLKKGSKVPGMGMT